MEAEIGVMLPQAKGHLGSLEAGRDKVFSPREFGGNVPSLHLDFRLWPPEL